MRNILITQLYGAMYEKNDNKSNLFCVAITTYVLSKILTKTINLQNKE